MRPFRPLCASRRRVILMNEQAAKLAGVLAAQGIDAFITYKPANTRYLTGFRGLFRSDGHAVVDKTGVHFFSSSMNGEQAKAQVEPGCPITLLGYKAGLGSALRGLPYSTVAIEESFLTVAELDDLKHHLPHTRFVYGDALMNGVRRIKTPGQIEKHRAACAITDAIWEALPDFMAVGVTEQDIADFILRKTRALGAEGPFFSPIVVSGTRASQPHGQPTDKALESGDFVTVDMGVVVDGCASDFTRTVVMGRASEKQRDIYETVRRAQQAAVDGIRPGMTSREADAIARQVIEDAGYGEYFIHSLGHGLDDGLRMSQLPEHEAMLAESMIFTIEPGIYIEGYGGVRIEDTVLLTADGCVPLYSSGKALLEL